MTPHSAPLFPLRIVLFPGLPQLLHVFEPRYRQLLADCRDTDRRFGLPLLKANSSGPEPGDVGSTALIKSETRLPDGRSNILIEGEHRFVIESVDVANRPYPVGTIAHFHDAPANEETRRAARGVWHQLEQLEYLFGGDRSAETMPEDATRASFRIAGRLNLDLSVAEELLRLTSAARRLDRLASIIEGQRAQAQRARETAKRHRSNGKHDYSPADGRDP